MTTLKIAVKGNRAALVGHVDLIVGTVGQPCVFYFDDSWKSLKKKITYKLGSTVIGSYDINDDKSTIPANAMSMINLPLEASITGYTEDRKTILPTAWFRLGIIRSGASMNNGDGQSGDHIIYDGGVLG